ncbi:MAG: MMPL family transporter [Bacteroidales bacterium]|nr:MMPL family transporter [Bacteroidales bacterium]
MREKILIKWGKITVKYYGWVLLGALIVTILSVMLASTLKLSTRWSDLMPLSDPKVQEFDKIIKEYSSASNSMVVIKGDEKDIKAFADDIGPRIASFEDDVKRVAYKFNMEFIENHGMMLSKAKDLEDMEDMINDLSLVPFLKEVNNSFEKTYVGGEDKISSKEQQDNAVAFLDGIHFWLKTMENSAIAGNELSETEVDEAVKRFLTGDPYAISYDKQMLLIIVEPTFSVTETDRVMKHVKDMQTILDERLASYPGVEAGLTGILPVMHDEMEYSMKDMETTSLLAFVLVIALFIISFRMWTTPLLAGVNLLIGIIWAAGFGAVFLDSLNIFTQMFAVILIGMGIDYSIHIISLYNESRHKGLSIADTVKTTLVKSGAGIITGAFTTSLAFFTLMISESRGIKEMGLIMGLGILATMFSSLIVLPAMLVSREKIISRFRKREPKPVNVEFNFLANLGQKFSLRPILYLGIALVISIFFIFQALNAKFDFNIMNMEPKGIQSVVLQDEIIESFDMSPDFSMVTATTVDEARELAEKARKLSSVSMVESISDYVPAKEDQAKRIPHLLKIRHLLNTNREISEITENNLPELIVELERLEMNIYELGQMAYTGGQDRIDKKCNSLIGDPEDSEAQNYILDLSESLSTGGTNTINSLNKFQNSYVPKFRKLALNMADTSFISPEILPDYITEQFYNKNKDHMLISIVPKGMVWDIEVLDGFSNQLNTVSEHITGTPIIIRALITYFGKDGLISTILAIIVVFFVLLIDFRNVKIVLITMIPLIFGAIWMVGLLNTFGLKLTLVNLMGIPMIVGIGIDFGVHFMHRYRIEGKGKIREVIASTGKAIMVTSLTTMAGFGSLMVAKYRGLGSLGILLTLGVAACFLTTMLFLPAILGWMEKRKE